MLIHIIQKKNNQKKVVNFQQGTTLIELILYIALIAIFLSAAVVFSWNIILSKEKANTQREVIQNSRLVTQRISYEIRNAHQILSLLDTDICLESTNTTYNPTRIYQSSGVLMIGWGGGSTDCSNLLNTQQLTNTNITLTHLHFEDQSTNTSSNNIGFEFTLESQGTRQEWQSSQTITGSVEVRTP